ncbi:acetyltransferase, GNAT family, partial [gut metagenome]
MIKIQRIKTENVDLYQFMENLITTAFPAEEYRALEQLKEYTDKVERFHNNVILGDEQPIGILTYWNFEDFYYIEHFATVPSMRNKGYGKKALEYVCTQFGKPI